MPDNDSGIISQLGNLKVLHLLKAAAAVHNESSAFCFPPTYGHDHPAQSLSKGPADQRQLQGDERQAHHAQDVRHRQVQDVDVGHRLHLGVAQDHVDHQGVAA